MPAKSDFPSFTRRDFVLAGASATAIAFVRDSFERCSWPLDPFVLSMVNPHLSMLLAARRSKRGPAGRALLFKLCGILGKAAHEGRTPYLLKSTAVAALGRSAVWLLNTARHCRERRISPGGGLLSYSPK